MLTPSLAAMGRQPCSRPRTRRHQSTKPRLLFSSYTFFLLPVLSSSPTLAKQLLLSAPGSNSTVTHSDKGGNCCYCLLLFSETGSQVAQDGFKLTASPRMTSNLSP